MFYAQLILAKKSSLSRLWLAVHWEKKLTKAQVYETNIPEACEHILRPYEDNPKTSLALRISAHLLLGVCRITYKKTSYLLSDCNEVYSKIKDSVDRFRTSAELMMNETSDDQQINFREAHPVDLDYDFDLALPDVDDITLEYNLKNNLSRLDDITLKDDFTGNFTGQAMNNMDFGMDDFGDNGLSPVNFNNMQFEGSSVVEHNRDASLLRHVNNFNDEPFEALQAPGCLEAEAAEDLNLPPPENDEMMEIDHFHMQDNGLIFGEPKDPLSGANLLDSFMGGQQENRPVSAVPDDDPDSFQLDSLDSDAILENQKGQRRRKRRLFIIDDYTEISNEELRANIDDYEDLIRPSEMAPPTKALMRFKETGTPSSLFSCPSISMGVRCLVKYYKSNCVLRVGDDRKSIDEANATLREELEFSDIEAQRLLPPSKAANYLFDNDALENIPPKDPSFGGMERCETPPEVHRLVPTPVRYPMELVQATPAKKQRLDESSRSDASSNGETWGNTLERTHALQNTIALKLNINEELKFSELVKKNSTRKAAAQKIYDILTLKKMEASIAIYLSNDLPTIQDDILC